MVKEGLDMYMAGEAWERAREIAKNIAPRCVIVDMSRERWRRVCICSYVQYVEQGYVEYLREQNRPDEVR